MVLLFYSNLRKNETVTIKKLIFALLLLLFPFSYALSQEESETVNPLILYMDKVYDVIPHAEIYEDKTGNLSFEEVIEKNLNPAERILIILVLHLPFSGCAFKSKIKIVS